MGKKKWKKKYKELSKNYDALWCDYMRLKIDDDRVKVMTDEQILHMKEVLVTFGENVKKAFENIRY